MRKRHESIPMYDTGLCIEDFEHLLGLVRSLDRAQLLRLQCKVEAELDSRSLGPGEEKDEDCVSDTLRPPCLVVEELSESEAT